LSPGSSGSRADLFIGRGLRDDIALADYRFERAVTSRGSGR
jgi:hypothetical protein